VYKQTVSRPRLRPSDRLFWVWLSHLWPGWQQTLAFVQPRTVIAWQKKRFRDHWRRLSPSGKLGRPAIAQEVRALIQDMWRANPTWGSPRIMGKLRKLSINVVKSTVEKSRPQPATPPSPTWKAFLINHVKGSVVCDCFTVPTATFRVLFVFIMLAHDRRRIVHINITELPTAQWTAQQMSKPCHGLPHRVTCCVIWTQCMARYFKSESATWASTKSRLHHAARGKIHTVSGSSVAYGATRLIT
jgi:putative transposase